MAEPIYRAWKDESQWMKCTTNLALLCVYALFTERNDILQNSSSFGPICSNKIQIRTWSCTSCCYFCYLELLIQHYLVQDINHEIYCVPWLNDPNSRSWGVCVCHQWVSFCCLLLCCFHRTVQNASQNCWYIVNKILLMRLWAKIGAFSLETLKCFLPVPLLKSRAYLLQKTHTHSSD